MSVFILDCHVTQGCKRHLIEFCIFIVIIYILRCVVPCITHPVKKMFTFQNIMFAWHNCHESVTMFKRWQSATIRQLLHLFKDILKLVSDGHQWDMLGPSIINMILLENLKFCFSNCTETACQTLWVFIHAISLVGSCITLNFAPPYSLMVINE